jgi:alkylation response protein AidB-like acyl-CoA dehydrogenase
MQEQDSLRHELLAQIASVAPILAERALESEKLGHLDDVSWGALRNTRLLGFLCPRELGGDDADPLTEFEVIEALARIDASASWVVGNLAMVSGFAGACLPSRSAQRIFANGIPLWPV